MSPPISIATRYETILGVRFFIGTAQDAIDEISRKGGLVVVPSAPGLKNLPRDQTYRDALLGADFAIADSGLMVLLWNLMQRNRIPKLSGLKYLRVLIEQEDFRQPGGSFWVMPSPKAAERNMVWLRHTGVLVNDEDSYVAPIYNGEIRDVQLIERLDQRRPKHVILGVGGGTQEQLGFYLKQNLSYRPAIHCIGAAIAFLSGDQVRIPSWIDELGLGWLWRSISNPRRFVPRYWNARHLVPLMLRYRDRMPLERPS
ncbi:MAG TPA: WecB/TagA/CpsF family glycosyltransferase [Terracidiphilus sp.]|jgi:UDP-N-acetyl-D-mannosaminuronic acid transferase (WecB/TagA/CpsF family)